MATWKPIDLSAVTPDGVEEVISTVTTTAGVLSPALSVAAAIIELIATLLQGASDPNKIVLEALQAAIDAIVSYFKNNVVAVLPYYTFKPTTVSGWLTTVAASMNDAGDTNRPQFDSSNVCAVVFMFAGGNLADLVTAFMALLQPLDLKPGIDPSYPDLAADNVSAGESQYPDWYGVSTTMLLPPLGKLIAKLDGIMKQFQPSADSDASMANFATALAERGTQLEALGQELQEIADTLEALASIAGGYQLVIREDGISSEDLGGIIQNSEDEPDFGDPAFAMGLTFVIAGDAASMDFFAGLFGGAS